MDVLKLRPHHINCLFFYRGKGYSESFVEAMTGLVTHLKATPDQQVAFVKQPDQLCHACPHLRDEGCKSGERIIKLDDNTLSVFGIKEGKVYPFKEIIEVIYRSYHKEDLEKICQACEWYKQGVCTEAIIPNQQKQWLSAEV